MRRMVTLLFVGVLVVAVAVPAGAGKPECGPDSTYPWCEPSDPPPTEGETGWWCEDRIENGAIWSPGAWGDDSYLITAPAGCIDIRPDLGASPPIPDHRGCHVWTVVVEGQTLKGTAKGMKLVFEDGIHAPGGVHAQTELTAFELNSAGNLSATWITPAIQGDADTEVPYTFVSMPRAGDRWQWIEITVTPTAAAGGCEDLGA